MKKVTQQEAVRSFVELTASSQLALSPVNQQQTPPRHEPALCKIPDLRTTLMQLQAAVHVAVWRSPIRSHVKNQAKLNFLTAVLQL